jgi:hypothetical protein
MKTKRMTILAEPLRSITHKRRFYMEAFYSKKKGRAVMDDEQAKEDARIAMLVRFRYVLLSEHRRALDAADREWRLSFDVASSSA